MRSVIMLLADGRKVRERFLLRFDGKTPANEARAVDDEFLLRGMGNGLKRVHGRSFQMKM